MAVSLNFYVSNYSIILSLIRMQNKQFLLTTTFLLVVACSLHGQFIRVKPEKKSNLMFYDALKSSLIIINDSIVYKQIDLNTGTVRSFPYYRDPYDSYSAFSSGYKIVKDELNRVYFIDRGCGQVYKWQNDSIIRIDHSFHHKNQFWGNVFMHKSKPYILGGYGYFQFKNMLTSYDFITKEWFKVSTTGNEMAVPPELNRLATKLQDKINFLVFKANYTGDSTQVYSLDMNNFKWTKLGALNLKIRFFDFDYPEEPSPFITYQHFCYYLDYKKNRIYKIAYPGKMFCRKLVEVNDKIIAITTSPNSEADELIIFNRKDFFKNNMETRPLLVPVVAPFNYSRLIFFGIGFVVLLLIYLLIRSRKNARVQNKEMVVYTFKHIEIALLHFWLKKPDLKIEMHEINDFITHDNPSMDTLKKRRENLLKGLKQALAAYFSAEINEEKAIEESTHPQDNRMKILGLNEKIALKLRDNKLGERD